MASFIALDFEGTGLLKKETQDPHAQPGIVQIGMVKMYSTAKKKKKWDGQLSIFLDPETFFEEKAQEITGISAEDTYGKPNLREKFKEITDFVLGVDILVTFNGIGYDIPLLQFNLQRYGLETRFPWPPMQYDLMKIATDVLNLQGKTGNKPPRLMELHSNLFGEEFEDAHDALSDARATGKCALELIRQGYIPI